MNPAKPASLKICIANPCSNDWNRMKRSPEGRFCQSCSNYVIDFSGKTDEEIKSFVLENHDKKICGRFHKHQVDRIRIEIDHTILTTGIPFWQKFLVVVLVCFGPEFLGVDFCFAQTDNDTLRVQTEEIAQTDSITISISQDSLSSELIIPELKLPDSLICNLPEIVEVNIEPFEIVIMGMMQIDVDHDEEPQDLKIGLTSEFPVVFPFSDGFSENNHKTRRPKNAPERPQNFMIAEEKKRRRRRMESFAKRELPED